MVSLSSRNGSNSNLSNGRSDEVKKSSNQTSEAVLKKFPEIMKDLFQLDTTNFPIPGIPSVRISPSSFDDTDVRTNPVPKRSGKRGRRSRKERVDKPLEMRIPKEKESEFESINNDDWASLY